MWQMTVRCGNAQAVKKLVRRLKRLKNEEKMVEQLLKFEMGPAQKGNETKHTAGFASVQGAEKLTDSSSSRTNKCIMA